jgi:hypothetical protein
LALLVAVVLLAVAVGVNTVLPGAASPSAAPDTESAYAKLFDQVGPNGEVTKEIALEAFALAIAPLPGITPPTGAPVQEYERLDGTFAIDWIRPYIDELPPAQKQVVMSVVAAPGGPQNSLQSSQTRQPMVILASDNPYVDAAAAAVPVIAGHLGRTLGLSWNVVIDTTQPQGSENEFAITYSTWFPLYGSGACDIHVHPLLVSSNDPAVVKATMAHEVFHCFQNDWFDKHGGFRALPKWIIEGQAEWAGEIVGGASSAGKNWWGTYLTTPEERLYQRTYDAIGFYQHLAEEGIDPWQHFDAMLATGGNDDAYKAAGAASDTFLDTWASGFYRDSNLGAPWYADGPWTLSAHAQPHEKTIGTGDSADLAASVVTDQDWTITSATDVLEVRMTGHVRMHTKPAGNETDTAQRWLCTKSGGCTCPPGYRYSGPDLEPVDPVVQFGLTGGLAGAGGTIRGHSLNEYCKPLPSQQPSSCGTDCGHSNGDPHLRTINRYRYDFQGAGEFVLLRNADSSVEIQARQEPYTGELTAFHAVSINTAIALRVNGRRVGVYAGADGLVLHVDGQQVDLSAVPDLGPGASVRSIRGGLEIDLPDGSNVWALGLGEWGINAIVQPSDSLRSNGMGLLGPITPGGMGVPALPDGTQLPAAPDFDTRHSILYGQFADAWRVTDATTLFDYDPGKSTATYTDHNFPSDADDAALAAAMASPDPARQATADSACASISDEDLHSDCVFDIYATADTRFAQQYGAQEDLYDSGIAASTPTPSGSPLAGVQKVVELQDLAGAAIGPDDTLYVSMDTSSGANELLAVDPTSAAIKQQVQMRAATKLHFAAGSVWAAGQTTDANGQHCSVTRYDPQTLATVGDFPIPCTGFEGAPRLTSMGDAVWFVDTSHTDPNTGAGTTLTRIDPSTNAPGVSVPLPQPSGCCQDSQGAIFCYCGQSDQWRLTSSDSSFVDLGNYEDLFPAGTGFWSEQGSSAIFVDAPGGPSITVPFSDPLLEDRVVGGDTTGVYVQGEPPDTPLSRVPTDGGPPVRLANAPKYGSGISETDLDYLSGGFPWFATPRGYLHLWLFKETPDSPMALWLQWAPLP